MDLKGLREMRGYSQEGLGALIGTSGRVIRRWENGERTPSVGKLPMIARALEVTYDTVIAAIGETHAAGATKVNTWKPLRKQQV